MFIMNRINDDEILVSLSIYRNQDTEGSRYILPTIRVQCALMSVALCVYACVYILSLPIKCYYFVLNYVETRNSNACYFYLKVFHLDTPDALLEFYTPGSTKDDAFQVRIKSFIVYSYIRTTSVPRSFSPAVLEYSYRKVRVCTIYAARGQKGVHIRQTTSAHVTTIM